MTLLRFKRMKKIRRRKNTVRFLNNRPILSAKGKAVNASGLFGVFFYQNGILKRRAK